MKIALSYFLLKTDLYTNIPNKVLRKMSYFTGSVNGFVPEVTFHSPKGDLHVTNVYAVSTAYIETNNRGQNFVIVESGKKKQRVNCGSVGEAETFLRDITKYIRSANTVYVDADSD